MASPRVESIPPKSSFAKVGCAPALDQPMLTNLSQIAAMSVPSPSISSNSTDEPRSQSRDTSHRRTTVISPQPPISSLPSQNTPQPLQAEILHLPQQTADLSLEGLPLVSKMGPSKKDMSSIDSAEDDQSHLSNSSTKQQSFETKSTTSVTTFAMDEKESIRPDDSASVRDDDDLASTLSRKSTFQQESSVIMPSLRGGAGNSGALSLAARRYPTLTNLPRFGDLDPPEQPLSQVSETPSSVPAPEQQDDSSIRVPPPPVSPDEKLLDALASPKDRLSILQLEERLLAFITHSTVEFIDLPPQNSYARLLAHKLADYYSLFHRINDDGQTIRIFRTASPNLPTPLTVLARSIPVGSAQSLPNAFKIMRRGGIGPRQLSTTNSTAPSSSAPSKATSEAGLSEEAVTSPTDAGTPSRDKPKPSREEREAQYKAARERIFGDFQEVSTGEYVSTGNNSAEISRSSSSSGKKKRKVPKDDTFDSRSSFVQAQPITQQQPMWPYPNWPNSSYSQPYYENSYMGGMGGMGGPPVSYGPMQNYGMMGVWGYEAPAQVMMPQQYGQPARSLFNPQSRAFVPGGRHTNKPRKADSLDKYGTPANLPKKPPKVL